MCIWYPEHNSKNSVSVSASSVLFTVVIVAAALPIHTFCMLKEPRISKCGRWSPGTSEFRLAKASKLLDISTQLWNRTSNPSHPKSNSLSCSQCVPAHESPLSLFPSLFTHLIQVETQVILYFALPFLLHIPWVVHSCSYDFVESAVSQAITKVL
jgi:hypothetical protein